MGVTKHLVAGLAVLAAATLTPSTSGATESTFSVSGQVVLMDRAPGSNTLWAIKRGMTWHGSFWDSVNYRVARYLPGEGWTIFSLPDVGPNVAIGDLEVIADTTSGSPPVESCCTGTA